MFADERSTAVNRVRQWAASRKQCRGNARTIHKSKYTCAAGGVYEFGQCAEMRRAMADIGIVACNPIATWRRKFGQWFARMGKRYWSVVQVLANSRARPSSTRPQAKASAWLDSGTV